MDHGVQLFLLGLLNLRLTIFVVILIAEFSNRVAAITAVLEALPAAYQSFTEVLQLKYGHLHLVNFA